MHIHNLELQSAKICKVVVKNKMCCRFLKYNVKRKRTRITYWKEYHKNYHINIRDDLFFYNKIIVSLYGLKK